MKPRLTQPIKKIAGLLGMLALLQTAQAQFTFPVYEPFSEYVANEDLGASGSSGNYWEVGNSASSNQEIKSSAALSYPGLQPDASATPLGVSGPPGVGRTREATFTAQTSGTIYSSVLINLKVLPSGPRAIYGLTSANSGTPNPGTGSVGLWVNSAGQLMLSKDNQTTPATNTTTALILNTTHLVVVGYTFATGANTNDICSIWLDPFQLGSDANVPAPNFTTTNGVNSLPVQGVILYAPSTTPTMQTYYDEIRVDNHWAGVTPAGPSPGGVFGVTGGGNGCPGDAFAVGLNGSTSGNTYLLYTNASFSGITANGTGSAITFGPQTATALYTVLASNITTAAVGWMTNTATVSVLASPSITSEPVSATVANNGLAIFDVVASGDGLHYQWYKNGTGLTDGGHISGSQTPDLTVSPATSADQATTTTGYYVIITNSCMHSATSYTNALVLDSPANLVWQGGNPNTNWDLSTTANWTNTAGTAKVFNSGDNVTFDDSSTNTVVTLVGNGLAPTTVNEVAAQSYYLTGSPIVGSGSLVMSGSGTLSISNDNSYTGGTTIYSGDVAVKDANQLALGTGTINLAGGELEIALKSAVANVGISNNINVTANSTLQFDGAASFALNLLAGLNGSPSATLTIQDYLVTLAPPDRVRFYGNFTNNCPIVVATGGDTVQLSPYNPVGSVVFNGAISGTGGQIVPRGAGNVILNGANTLNDSGVSAGGNGPSGYSLLLSSGNVGFGADSSVGFSAFTPGGGSAAGTSPAGTGSIGIDTTAGNDSMLANGGAHTVANPVFYTSATNTVTLSIIGTNNLTLSGTFTLSGADGTGPTNRTLNVTNSALTTISGVVGDAGLACGIYKTGGGKLALANVNTYTGPTLIGGGALWVNGQLAAGSAVTVTNGSLGGTGTVLGPVSVQSPGSLAPGTASIGTLTVNNSLTLAGNAVFKVNKSLSPAQSNDVASVSGALSASGTGTLTVTNYGPALVVGDRFVLFNGAVSGGSALTIAGGGTGVTWTNKLATDGSVQVLSISTVVPVTVPPHIGSFTLGAANLVINATNGVTGGIYYLLGTTNLTKPLGQWASLATNVVTTNGVANAFTFTGTNVVIPGDAQQFYILSSTNN
jgi:autotransporter-associated beta strand protein